MRSAVLWDTGRGTVAWSCPSHCPASGHHSPPYSPTSPLDQTTCSSLNVPQSLFFLQRCCLFLIFSGFLHLSFLTCPLWKTFLLVLSHTAWSLSTSTSGFEHLEGSRGDSLGICRAPMMVRHIIESQYRFNPATAPGTISFLLWPQLFWQPLCVHLVSACGGERSEGQSSVHLQPSLEMTSALI